MTSSASRWLLLAAGLLVVIGVPLTAKWVRRDTSPRCEYDGLKIESLYRIRVLDRAGGSHAFCCVRCAGRWLARQGEKPEAIYVTDEASGGEIDAHDAIFVNSTVVTNAITGNRVHAFRDRTAAEEHVRAFNGTVLPDGKRLFSPGS